MCRAVSRETAYLFSRLDTTMTEPILYATKMPGCDGSSLAAGLNAHSVLPCLAAHASDSESATQASVRRKGSLTRVSNNVLELDGLAFRLFSRYAAAGRRRDSSTSFLLIAGQRGPRGLELLRKEIEGAVAF